VVDTLPASAGTSDARYVAQALELVDTLKSEFQERDALYERIDRTLYTGYETKIPKGYKGVGVPRHNPLPIFFTNTITAALTVDPPAVQFPVTGAAESQQVNATLREHFFDASWVRQEEEAESPLFRRFVHSVVCRGEGVLKTLPRTRSAWADYASFSKELEKELTTGKYATLDADSKDRYYDSRTEEYKKTVAPYPLRSADVDAMTWYYWKGDDGLTLAVEHKQVPYLETLTRYGMALDREGRIVPQGLGQALPVSEWRTAMAGTSTLTLTEMWTWNRCAYILSGQNQFSGSNGGRGRGELVKTFTHRYGDPVTQSLRGPYAHCLGTTTGSRLPERAGLGVLYGFLDLFDQIDEMQTVQQINAVMTGLASFKRNRPPGTGVSNSDYGDDGRQSARQPLTIMPGYVLPDDVGPIEMPRAGQALGEYMTQLMEWVNLILPKVLQGVVDTTDSGYQLALAARLGRVAFDPIVANLRTAMARRTSFESWCIEHEIGETVYAVGVPIKKAGERSAPQGTVLAIGPADLKGIHRYKVYLEPEDKASELVEVRKHAEMVQAGFEARSQAIEALGGNWEEVELARTVEEIMADPAIKAQLKQRVLQKIGQMQQTQVAAADQALAQVAGGAPPAPGPGAPVPPGALGPPPGAPGMPLVGQPGGPQAGSALQGAGQVYEAGQGMPFAPPGPGVPAIAANAAPPGQVPGGLPGTPAGAPGFSPGMLVNQNPAQAGPGLV